MLPFTISFCIDALLKPKSRILGHCLLASVIWPILTYFSLSGDVYYRIHDALASDAFMKRQRVSRCLMAGDLLRLG
jgi:hypothetical protein